MRIFSIIPPESGGVKPRRQLGCTFVSLCRGDHWSPAGDRWSPLRPPTELPQQSPPLAPNGGAPQQRPPLHKGALGVDPAANWDAPSFHSVGETFGLPRATAGRPYGPQRRCSSRRSCCSKSLHCTLNPLRSFSNTGPVGFLSGFSKNSLYLQVRTKNQGA